MMRMLLGQQFSTFCEFCGIKIFIYFGIIISLSLFVQRNSIGCIRYLLTVYAALLNLRWDYTGKYLFSNRTIKIVAYFPNIIQHSSRYRRITLLLNSCKQNFFIIRTTSIRELYRQRSGSRSEAFSYRSGSDIFSYRCGLKNILNKHVAVCNTSFPP
uniref:Uncharacterized protein n=1 Tax=Cacopsylla melanoneura TaxID=428564 RepID=A0A8D8LKB3_9HEMI